mmetsp:Transcript_7251/g.31994  ORF Transcript_7251/g.31994 Transcript_7251/m.31994 type:complete len:229 (+) Transcript_7251:979-1665(+)
MGGWATRGLSHETNTRARGSVHRATELFERVTAAEVRGGGGGAGPEPPGPKLREAGAQLQAQLRRVFPGEQPAQERRQALARHPARRRRQEAPRREERQGEREEEEQEQTEPTAERENDSNSRRSPRRWTRGEVPRGVFHPNLGGAAGTNRVRRAGVPARNRERPVQGGSRDSVGPQAVLPRGVCVAGAGDGAGQGREREMARRELGGAALPRQIHLLQLLQEGTIPG